MTWDYTQSAGEFGLFIVKVWLTDPGAAVDVTFFRDVPTIIENYTYADPFADATASIRFPQLTGLDGPSTVPWFKRNTNVDIYWLPATTSSWHAGEQVIIHPLSQQRSLYLHTKTQAGAPILPIWEGYFTTIQPSLDGVTVQCQGALYQLDRYYAKPLYAGTPKTVESMIARYFDPARRGLYTKALFIAADENSTVEWGGWTKFYTQADYDGYRAKGTRYIPSGIKPSGTFTEFISPGGSTPPYYQTYSVNTPWTGYITRNTGAWERALTGYIQNQLSIMYTESGSSGLLSAGDQWTIGKRPGRQPVMFVRKQSKPPTLVAWFGQPGVVANLTQDDTQAYNVVFGAGVGADVQSWSGQRFPKDVGWSAWTPLWPLEAPLIDIGDPYDPAQVDSLYVGDGYKGYDSHGYGVNNDLETNYDGYYARRERELGQWVSEKYVTMPDGIDYGEAQQIAENWVRRDSDPGWNGTIEISVDLRDNSNNVVSKWKIKSGDVIWLKGFYGTGTSQVPGVNLFHVAMVEASPINGTVNVTVDTKFRDLLTVEEAIARGRDTLAPVRALQINKQSALINDLAMPWNVKEGSGVWPRTSKDWHPEGAFPYEDEAKANPPKNQFTSAYKGSGNGKVIGKSGNAQNDLRNAATVDNPYYVPINSGSSNASRRWAIYPVLMNQAGSISRTEFAIYDKDGNIVKCEFHVSVYRNPNVPLQSMPMSSPGGGPPQFSGAVYAALFPNAFETYDRTTGLPFDADNEYAQGPADLIIGWGTDLRPAGYSPYSKDGTAAKSGLLIDSATWGYNMVGDEFHEEFPLTAQAYAESNPKELDSWASLGVAVYVEQTSEPWVYVRGRFYRDLSGQI